MSPGAMASLPRVSRRRFFQTGGAAVALWSSWARAWASQPQSDGRARSVVMIFNCGGPSHIDLWDPKPDAGDNVRGLYQPIATKVPGVFVSELLPRMAERMDKLAVIRSVHHTQSAHNAGMYWSTVGRPYRVDSTLINPSPTDYPGLGTLCGWLAERDGYTGAAPPYVITPFPHCDSTVYLTPGQYGGCLGVRHDPFVVDGDPNSDKFQVRNLRLDGGLGGGRLNERLALRDSLERERSTRLPSRVADEWQVNDARAAQMLLSGDAARAFDLSQEKPETRDRYGRHEWGQSHLLARRLIEAGSKFVTTVNGRGIVWDTHKDNFGRMSKALVPPMEQAYAALLDDLEERGLLETTLVLWLGDFGRTPIINKDAGRDHWPNCFSAVLAGGGIAGGQVIGASDKTGAYPASRPVAPADLHATVFKALGYDPRATVYHTTDGRPTPLSEGEAIAELL